VQVAAPRWSLVRGERDAWIQCALFLVALLLAAGGVFLAWHASDQVATHRGAAPPLTDQIGPWAVAIIVIGGAVAAAVAAFRSAKVHLDMAVNPATAPDVGSITKPVPVGQRQSEVDSHDGGDSPPTPPATQSDNGAIPTSTAPEGGTIVDPRSTASPKVVAGAMSTLASASFWTIAAATFWHTVEPVILTALGTAVTAIAGAVAAWWKTDPLRVAHVNQSRPAAEQH
jgi:hypothetical protein